MDRRSFIQAGSLAIGAATLPSPARAAETTLDDVTIVRRALELHPGLYRYQSPREFAVRHAAFARAWTAASDNAERFLALSRLTAQVRCGHTQCNPFNQTEAVVADLFDRPTRAPFTFRWIEGAMIVTGDSGMRTGIARGSRIERLNGRRPGDILAALVQYARADGSNDAKRRVQMEMRGDEEFEAFDIYQGLLFPPGPGGHQVAWREPGGSRRSATLPAISYAARRAERGPEPDEDGGLWDWRMNASGIAVLTMPTWVTYHGAWDWQAWLNQRLAGVNSAKGLIIDIRLNEGGTDCGTLLLQHLIGQTVHPLRYISKVRFREAPADLVPYLKTWDRSFRTIGKDAPDVGGGFYRVSGDEDDMAIAPFAAEAPQVRVPTAVLMGPINSSATFSFVRRVKETGAARLFGGPSGGNLRGINGGAMFFVRLPQSGLEFDLPLKGYFPEVPRPDAPVVPDARIEPTAADIAAERDPAMEAAVRFLLSR